MNSKAVKITRKVERPRPLRSSSSENNFVFNDLATVSKKELSEILPEFEKLYISIVDCSFDEKAAEDIKNLCNLLKTYGAEMDSTMKNMLNHYFVTLRNISREDRLDAISRLRLLQIIEMKAMGWQINENIISYYKKKITDLEGIEKAPYVLATSMSSSQVFNESTSNIGVPLAPGEIIRSSGKFINPTKIAGKNYFKDEVVIRNSDSGKVNPGARDRRVQIAGPNEEAISYAKTLVEDTIRKNASPVREQVDNNLNIQPTRSVSDIDDNVFSKPLAHSFSMGDASIGEYTEFLPILGETIKICGKNMDILKMIKRALQEYFPAQELSSISSRITYSDNANKSELKKSTRSNMQQKPLSWLKERGTSVSPVDTSSEEEIMREDDINYKIPDYEESSSFSFEISDDNIDPPLIPPPRNVEPRKVYSHQFMLKCRESLLSKLVPQISSEVYLIYPMMIRNNDNIEKSQTSQDANEAE